MHESANTSKVNGNTKKAIKRNNSKGLTKGKRKLITIRTDAELESDIIRAKEATGITLDSQLIRTGVKRLIPTD